MTNDRKPRSTQPKRPKRKPGSDPDKWNYDDKEVKLIATGEQVKDVQQEQERQ